MLFSDPHNFIGRHNPAHFCVTDSFHEARRFYDRNVAGTIALRNEQTLTLSHDLTVYNETRPSMWLGDFFAARADIMNRLTTLIQLITDLPLNSFEPEILDSIKDIGWDDPPHVDENEDSCRVTALLAGIKDRTTEISSKPPLLESELSGGSQDMELRWGTRGSRNSPHFGEYAPICFLPGTLIMLLSADQKSVLHRIPRRLHENEMRGCILKAR